MAQRAASYGAAVLHKSLTMKHCFAKAPQYEASPFHSDMKHFAYAPYEFFAQMGKKHEAVRLRFIPHPRCFIFCGDAAKCFIKKRLTMKHCFAKAPQYEAASFHSAMKHFAYAPYEFFAQNGQKK